MDHDDPGFAVRQLLGAQTWEATRDVVQRYRGLLTVEADAVLTTMVEDAQRRGDQELARYVDVHRRLLRRCAEVGIEVAFSELDEEAASVDGSAAQQLDRALQAFLEASTLQEVQQVLERHPELLSQAADQLLAAWLRRDEVQADDSLRHLLEENRALLQRIQAVGLDSAVAERTLNAIAGPENLVQQIQQLAGADYEQALRLLQEHPELLDEDTDHRLESWAAAEAAKGRHDVARLLHSCQQLLRRCREIGVTAALDEQTGSDKRIQRIVQEYAQVTSWAEARALFARHPELASHAAERYLARLVATARASTELQEIAEPLEQQLAAVRRVRELGIEQAFANLPPTLQEPPPALEQAFQEAEATEAAVSGEDRQGFELRIAAWDDALQHPDLPLAPARWRFGALNNLGRAYLQQFFAFGDLSDLEDAIQRFEAALAAASTSALRQATVANLSSALRERFRRSGDANDLDRALDLAAQTVADLQPGAPDRAHFLDTYGLALWSRLRHRHDPADLDQAIAAFSDGLDDPTAGDNPDLPHHLGVALEARWSRDGRRDDLEQAIELLERATAGGTGSGASQDALVDLAEARRNHAKLTTNRDELDGAIAFANRLVDEARPNSPRLAAALQVLGNCLVLRWDLARARADLYRAVQVLEHAVDLTPAHADDYPGRLNDLGGALSRRGEAFGDVDALTQAVELGKEALTRTPTGSSAEAGRLTNLGVDWWKRSRLTGDLEDLERAIQLYEQAAAVAGHLRAPERLGILHNLVLGLNDQYTRTGEVESLVRALRTLEQLGDDELTEAPDRANHLNTYASTLRLVYRHTGDLSYLDQAIERLEQAVAAAPTGSLVELVCTSSLSAAVYARFERTRTPADLDRAIDLAERVLAATPPDSADLPSRLNSLANCLADRYTVMSDLADLRRAVDAYRDSCHQGRTLISEAALAAAKNWSKWAMDRTSWDEVIEACRYGIEAANRLFEAQLARRHKEAWLREARDLPARLAYGLASTGDPAGAALALEQGRAQLLSDALERDRADLDRLRTAGHGRLVDRYREAADRVQALEGTDLLPGRPDQPVASADERRAARAELEAAIAEIRAVAGYERFLAQPVFADINEISKREPLVYLAAAEAGGLALIVGVAGHGEASIVWLPELTSDGLRTRLVEYLDADEGRANDPGAWLAALDSITGWLWDAVMGPLLPAVAANGRAVLVPTGLLGLVPLHAAWSPDSSRPSGRRYALDGVRLTYAPNARALQAADRRAGEIHADSALGVDDPRPVTAGPLPNAGYEVRQVLAAFPDACHLAGTQATRRAVLDALDDYQVLHFACHGAADLAVPLDSSLLLSGDEKLTLRDLMRQRLPAARLAVLSACETGLAGAALPDEVVSLPAGLLQAGVAAAVGSLWSVADASTALLMSRFYQLWRGDGLDPAEALRQAQGWVRDATNEEKLARFPLVLAGQAPSGDAARAFWSSARTHTHPHYWAAFAYVGV
jgi:hypothetical protein